MRKGYEPAMFLNKKGRMFGFCTGSDACAEHEVGSRSMQEALCARSGPSDEEVIRSLRNRDSFGSRLTQAIGLSGAFSYPQLLERKALSGNLDHIAFLEGQDKKTGEPVAMIHFSARGQAPNLEDPELNLGFQKTVAGAWDEHGFAFKVWGEKAVKKLQAFHQSLLAGNGVFAGTFLESHDGVRPSGVTIVDRTLLRGEHLAEIKNAQEKWEADMRLKARSELDDFYLRVQKVRRDSPTARHIDFPGFIWPVWRDEVDGEIAYALNPGYRVKAPYYGPYDLAQLERWTLAENKFDLTPLPKAEALVARKMTGKR